MLKKCVWILLKNKIVNQRTYSIHQKLKKINCNRVNLKFKNWKINAKIGSKNSKQNRNTVPK